MVGIVNQQGVEQLFNQMILNNYFIHDISNAQWTKLDYFFKLGDSLKRSISFWKEVGDQSLGLWICQLVYS